MGNEISSAQKKGALLSGGTLIQSIITYVRAYQVQYMVGNTKDNIKALTMPPTGFIIWRQVGETDTM